MQSVEPQGLDRNAVLGILLISLLLLVWMLTQAPQPEDFETVDPTEEIAEADPEAEIGPTPDAVEVATLQAPSDSLFASAVGGDDREIVIVTERQRAVLSTQGGTFRSVQLPSYRNAVTDQPVELIADSLGALAVGFSPPTGSFVDTRTLSFTPVVDGQVFTGDSLVVGEESREIAFEARVGEGALRFVYTFEPDAYQVGFRVETPGTDLLDQGERAYDLTWDGALPRQEGDAEQEAAQAGAYVNLGGETDVLRLTEEGAAEDEGRSGDINWVAVKTKFFVAAILPSEGTDSDGARLSGQQIGEATSEGFAQDYTATLEMHGLAANEAATFTLYLGPVELRRLAALDMYDVVDFGFGETITRPISRYIIAPTLALLTSFIPSFGIAILVFALLIKLVLWPLTAASYKNAARMRELQPKMAAIKEKYGDDPQKQQEAVMGLYRSEKINPLGGCLPMLLQYPILISLWRYFQSTLVLRQEGFLWAQDLSAPDPILNLPFTIPFYGDFVAGFTLLMGLSMIVQMKVSMSGSTAIGSQQKVIMYVLPLTFFLFFNRFPSGLSLYYLGFNLLSIVQQRLVNKKVHDQIEAGEDLKPKSPSRNGKASTNGAAKKRRKKPGRSLTSDVVSRAKKGGKRK
ncbi:MAG: membrane protein insertase YidC [Bacteroidota bacterium]